jgi:hypothetical protein
LTDSREHTKAWDKSSGTPKFLIQNKALFRILRPTYQWFYSIIVRCGVAEPQILPKRTQPGQVGNFPLSIAPQIPVAREL